MNYRKRIVQVMTGRLARLGLAHHPGLLIRPTFEGYRDYAFGGRAGPQVAVEHLFHELGHAAEFGPDEFRRRAGAYGFAFKIPQEWIYDRFCPVPQTMQATARELRTFAHQYHLMQRAGCKIRPDVFAASAARAMPFMHDWWFVPGEGDEGRINHAADRILALIDELDPKDVLSRLEAWLDATARRLRRLRAKGETALTLRAPRLRGDGTVYQLH